MLCWRVHTYLQACLQAGEVVMPQSVSVIVFDAAILSLASPTCNDDDDDNADVCSCHPVTWLQRGACTPQAAQYRLLWQMVHMVWYRAPASSQTICADMP
jgi:hypothetical protein